MPESLFTYNWYSNFLNNLKENDYKVCDYDNWSGYDRCAILRHDIDNDIEKAVKIAEIENDNEVRSTYFVLLTSDFYNVFSLNNINRIKRIISLGHDIGLHFDEVRYKEISTIDEMIRKIEDEADILSTMIGHQIRVVSMHRPSEKVLEADITMPNLINSYGNVFFNEFKYLSDSRKRWREPVDKIICGGEYDRLHILIHPFWYNDSEINIHDSIYEFVNNGNLCRYKGMNDNITRLSEIMTEDEVL